MATPDRIPAEENLERAGRQLSADEARGVARGDLERDVTASALGGELENSGASRGASGGTGNQHVNEEPPDAHPYAHSRAALGGADAVQKTSYGVGMGTGTDGRLEHAPVGLRKGEGTVVGRTGPGGGINPVAWIVGLLAVIAAVVYGAGMLTG